MSGLRFTAEEYVEDVISGRQVACEWVRLACERYRRDQETGHERGLVFDERAAKVAIAFFSTLKHSKGEWAGRPVILEPWQQFVVWNVFGWKRDGSDVWVEVTPQGTEDTRHTRRFRTLYLEVARKNGKSTLAAGIGLFMLAADGEPGAEVYTAATKRDQARITHSEATRMVKASPALRRMVGVFKDNLHIEGTASKYEPLGADANSMDGLNVHCFIADEVHAHRTRAVWDVLETATGSRRQPLGVGITTAGFDRQSLCYELHDYAVKVVSGVVEDDSFFGLVYTLDPVPEEEQKVKGKWDWTNEAEWVKSNPNLGVSKKWDDMRRKCLRAKQMPAAQNAFLRLETNVWTQSVTKWIRWDKWAGCGGPVDPDGLRGRECYGGLDLSSNIDTTSYVLVFPPVVEGDPYLVLPRFFIPEDNIHERVERDKVQYDAWVRQGFLTATPGDVVDYEFVYAQMQDDAAAFDWKECAFDRWGADKVVQDLAEVFGDDFMVQMGQGFASMNSPMMSFERLIIGGLLAHGNHPVLRWQADNLVVRMDAAGNVKPDKEKSIERIDGMVALVMALDRAMRHGGGGSVYEGRGVLTL